MSNDLDQARAGDARAFERLVAPHRTVLFAHCYRMLASSSDADDAVQESLVRAWKHLRSYEERASLRSWLLTIATRSSLDLLGERKRRRLPAFDGIDRAGDPTAMPAPPVFESVWIEPCADDRLADGPIDQRESPEAALTRRESVRLAFIAALQWLPASQRAALLLHDVMGWPASDVAASLETTVASVNSALQRARSTVAEKTARRATPSAADTTSTIERYVLAWERGDADGLARVLRDDALLAMPPVPTWFDGREAIVGFFAGFVLAQGMAFKLRVARSTNGCVAIASYREQSGAFVADGLHVIELDERGAIDSIVVFMGEAPVLAQGLPGLIERNVD